MKIEEKYHKAFSEPGGPDKKLDRLMFEVELNLGRKVDNRGKVKYADIFEEIMDARVAIQHLL